MNRRQDCERVGPARRTADAVRFVIVSVLAVVTSMQLSPAAAEETAQESSAGPPNARQRIEFGVEWSDAGGVTGTGSVSYLWAPLKSHSFGVLLPLVVSDLIEDFRATGVGDLELQYNYAPSVQITANPWVPNTLGTGLGLIMPTGDPEKGLGGDQWVIEPGVGWVIALGRRTSLLPRVQYSRSFAEGDDAQPIDLLLAGVGLLHVTKNGFWVQYSPAMFREFEIELTEIGHELIVGMQFSRRFAASLDLATVSLDDAQSEAVAGIDAAYLASLKLHWILAFE